jgi:hypothetical protein
MPSVIRAVISGFADFFGLSKSWLPLLSCSLSLSKAIVCKQIVQTPSNSPLVRGRTGIACLEHDEILYLPPLQGGTKGGSDCMGFR